MEGGREDGGDFFGFEAGDEGLLCCAVVRRGAEEAHAGPDAEFGQGDVGGEFAQVFEAEGGRERGGGEGEADFLVGFAAGGLEGGFGQGVCSAWVSQQKQTPLR